MGTRTIYVGHRSDGRPLYRDGRDGRLVGYAGSTGNMPSARRFLMCTYGDGSTRCPRAGTDVIGHPVHVHPVNLPRGHQRG